VTFGGVSATSIVTVNDTTITCTTPAGAAGAVNVVVTNNWGSATLVSGFTYVSSAQGEVTLKRDRADTLDVKERGATLAQGRDLTTAIDASGREVTLKEDRDLADPVTVKTRRPLA